MRLDINVNFSAPRLESFLQDLITLVRTQGEREAMHLQAIQDAVTKITGVVESAAVLIKGISAKLDELKGDPTEVANLAQELNDQADKLAEAVAAGTPAEE